MKSGTSSTSRFFLPLAVTLVAGVGFILPLSAKDAAIDPALEQLGWTLFSSPRWPSAHFHQTTEGAIEATTNDSTSLIWARIDEADTTKSRLTWTWKVDINMPPTDITKKGGDDRPLAFHVWFENPHERKGFFRAIRSSIAKSIVGFDVDGYVLTYVWGGFEKDIKELPNPHVGDRSWMFVLQTETSPLGTWITETRDLESDFEKAFGKPAPKRRVIAVAADGEDTDTRSKASIKDIVFAGP